MVESLGAEGVVAGKAGVEPRLNRVLCGAAVLVVTRYLITEVQVEVQFGEEVQGIVELEVTGRRERLVLVVLVVEQRHGVLDGVAVDRSAGGELVPAVENRGHGLACAVDSGVVGLYGLGGVGGEGVAESREVSLAGLHVCALHVCLNRQMVVEEFRGEVETCGHALHTRGLDYTLVVGVAHVDAVREETGHAADREVIVLRHGGAQNLFLPVGIVHLAVVAELCDGRLCAHAVGDEVGELGGVHHVEGLAGGVHGHVGREVYLRLAAAALLGGDDDDAVRCARTVDCGCRGILEHGHRLDVLRVDHCHGRYAAAVRLVRLGHAVDDDQGVVRCRERRAATDTDRSAAGGVTAVGGDYHARRRAHQEILGRDGDAGLDFIGLDYGHRTGGVRFLDGTVTDGHHLVQGDSARLELDVDDRAVVYGHTFGVIPHV